MVAADRAAFKTAVKVGAIVLIIAGAGTVISGDLQSKVMFEVQPMKMAAAEALYETQQPAGFSVITIGTPDGERELWSVNVPGLLSFLATGSFDGKVTGINELQQQYTEQFGPGTYYPYIPLTYWSFRWMIGLGMAGIAVGALLLVCLRGERRLTSFWWPTAADGAAAAAAVRQLLRLDLHRDRPPAVGGLHAAARPPPGCRRPCRRPWS